MFLLLIVSFIVALAIGTYIGKLIASHFNDKTSPFAKTKEVSDYVIMKEFEEADDQTIK